MNATRLRGFNFIVAVNCVSGVFVVSLEDQEDGSAKVVIGNGFLML